MNRMMRLMMATIVLFGLWSPSVRAKECEFEFYYQRIEKVEQINNPNPQGWWEKTKSFLKGVGNKVASVWEKQVTRNFFPGSGSKRWYSEKDPNIAYQVVREKVRDEAHLLQLMGVTNGDLSKLTSGQKAMLEVYRHSKSQAIADRMKYSFRSKVKVLLTDTTGFDDASKYPNLEKDFWPYSSGFMISMNTNAYNYWGSEADARSTFVHEFAHTLDMTFREFVDSYGPDGSHFCNEITKKRSAFLEGFAEFNEMLDYKAEYERIKSALKVVKKEGESGKYTEYPANGTQTTGLDLTNVEGINAMIMYRLATEIPGGRDNVFASFKTTNYPWRSLKDFLRDFVGKNPKDAETACKILNDETYGKLSDDQMKDFLGTSAAVVTFLSGGRGKNVEKAASTTDKEKASVKPVSLGAQGTGANPFSE